jgi:hypothetical protein
VIPACDEAIERAREVLRVLVSLSDVSQREVKRRLVEAKSGADVSRLLRGPLDPKLRHVLDICCILGIHHGEFFGITYPRPAEPSALLLMVREVLAPRNATPAVHDGGPQAG